MTEKQRKPSRWLRHTRDIFLTGILAAIPVVVTYLIFRWLFDVLDGIFQPAIRYLTGQTLPGAGLVALVVLVYVLGLVATNVVGRRLVHGINALLSRTPVIQYVYSAATEVVTAVRGLKQVPFKRVVVVEFPKVGNYSLGFVTGKPIDFKGEPKIPLFIPHTPNPMTGFLVMIAAEDIIDTDITVDEAMRMVLSGGLLSPDSITKHVAEPIDKGNSDG